MKQQAIAQNLVPISRKKQIIGQKEIEDTISKMAEFHQKILTKMIN